MIRAIIEYLHVVILAIFAAFVLVAFLIGPYMYSEGNVNKKWAKFCYNIDLPWYEARHLYIGSDCQKKFYLKKCTKEGAQ